ncbi:hypothetical protein BGX21_005296, partial [Mortierella sp. AD011]
MDSSDWIWISAGASPLLQQQNALGGAGAHGGGGSGGGGGGGGGGAFGDFAMSMPSFRPGQ